MVTLAHAYMPVGVAHGRPPDFPNPQTLGSTVWEPEFVIPKACVHMHEAQRPVFDKGACTCPDLWPNLCVVTINPDIYFRSASQLEGEQTIHPPCVGSKLHPAPSAPQICSSSLPLPPLHCHLTPSRARICRVEKALPPSGAPPRTVVLGLRSYRACTKKTCRKQGECHPYWATHLCSLKTLTLLGLRVWSRMRTLGKSNPHALTRMNEGCAADRVCCTSLRRGYCWRRTR